jgi:hypothetical protein
MPRKARPGTPRNLMALRRWWLDVMTRAGSVTCRRCGQPIRPGDAWDLGHPPDKPYAKGNKTEGLAPEHRQCNRTGYVGGPDTEPTFGGWN